MFIEGAGTFAAAQLFGCATARREAVVRFGLVTDCHYADRSPWDDGVHRRYYRAAQGKLAECVKVMNSERPDFLIELGDLKDKSGGEEGTLRNLDTIEAELAKFEGSRYHVLGNHDEDEISKSQFLNRVSNAGFPKALAHYSFSVNGVKFIVLDANFNADFSAYDHGNFDWCVAVLPPDQVKWLESELADGDSPAVVFCHQRLDSDDELAVRNAPEVRRILERSGRVVAVFTGHHHAGGFNRINGIPYYTLPAVIEGQDAADNAYAIASVDSAGGVSIVGYRKLAGDGVWKERE